MSTANPHNKSDPAASSSENMPSSCTSSSGINGTNSSNIRTNAEQPQTKRQKIEKSKTSSKNIKATNTKAAGNATGTNAAPSTKSLNNRTQQPPDIIDTNEMQAAAADSHNDKIGNQLCSSLSSSAQSISSPPSSLNNSPSSTPSSSRATSLSQLLNVQNCAVNSLPSQNTKTVSPTDCVGTTCATTNVPNIIGGDTTPNNGGNSSLTTQSTDEVDRIAILPDLLPHLPINAKTSKAKSTTAQAAGSSIDAVVQDMRQFEQSLTRQCLCGVSEDALQKPFQSHYSLDANGQKRIANLSEWPTHKLLQFLSNLQLLFDIYLKQNSKGFICARIMDVCDALIRNDRNLIDEIIVLAGYNNAYVQFLAGRVLASFLVIAKEEMDDNWLKKLVDNLFIFERLDHVAVQKIHFSLEIIKRVIEWKDIDLHPLEDEIVDTRTTASTADVSGAGSDRLESQHAYMHFQTRQPTLETNYFAVHFGALDESGANENLRAVLPNGTRQEIITNQFDNYENAAQMHARMSNDFGLHVVDSQAFHLTNAYAPHVASVASTVPSSVYNNIRHAAAHFNEDVGAHFALDSANLHNSAPTPLMAAGNCNIVTLTDSESFDTTSLKCITIKILENKWPALVRNMSSLIENHLEIENAENCVLNFLQLWENIISVKANLSVVETLPFYAQLDKFESLLLNRNLSCIVYKQMLCLFNEALCYGSTLALQDMLPEETCMLAHQIVRHVKDFRILESLPRRQPENIVGLIGFKRRPVIYASSQLQPDQISSNSSHNISVGSGDGVVIEMDKTILQKMVLLVLKSIAVTVKEIRSDSSDSSIDSTDYDAFQDMVLIERSIRGVLQKLESFIKGTLDFHPECHFSKILIHLFDDQDDHLIEAMVCTLDVTSGISFRNNAFPDLVAMLNPVYTFLEFLKMISNSSDLLLDLLVSNETCFLLYLLRFLKYIRLNWAMFVQSCHDFGMGASILDEAMSVLIRLRLQISRLVSRQLYPYDISPVLRLLESCESLYEGNELS